MGRKPKPLTQKKIILTLRVTPAVKRGLEKAAAAEADTLSHKAETILAAALRAEGFMK